MMHFFFFNDRDRQREQTQTQKTEWNGTTTLAHPRVGGLERASSLLGNRCLSILKHINTGWRSDVDLTSIETTASDSRSPPLLPVPLPKYDDDGTWRTPIGSVVLDSGTDRRNTSPLMTNVRTSGGDDD